MKPAWFIFSVKATFVVVTHVHGTSRTAVVWRVDVSLDLSCVFQDISEIKFPTILGISYKVQYDLRHLELALLYVYLLSLLRVIFFLWHKHVSMSSDSE
jgi:hypothetical protein